MKICIVPTMFPKYKGDYYGSFVYDEAKELVKRGYEVHVLTQHNPKISYEEIMDGIIVHRFRWLEPKKFKALVHFMGVVDTLRIFTLIISLFFNLFRLTYKNDFNIIHAHSTVPTGLVAVLVSKIMKIPIFITVHGMDVNNYIEHPFKRLISFTLKNCDMVITVSNDLAKKVKSLGVDGNNIKILRNAVDTNRFKPSNIQKIRKKYNINEKDILILFVGYLDTFKGVFELLGAFHELSKKRENIKLMMVGEGPKITELKNKVSEFELEKSVIFAGKISHKIIEEYYQSADIFVLPSYSEGVPLSILEAMASGLPIISTKVGGIPEIIEEGKNGFLVYPKDKKKLEMFLDYLVQDQDLKKTFAKNSIQLINKGFKIKSKINELIKLYKN